jgi:hypothetical protein
MSFSGNAAPEQLRNQGRELPYELPYFAQKHDLTLRTAQVILTANGPYRRRCDLAVQAFLAAVAARKRV